MKHAEQQDMCRDLQSYKDQLRSIKTLLIELEGRIMMDFHLRNSQNDE